VNGQKDFLDNIFRLRPVPNNLVRQIEYGPKETQEEKVEAILAAVRDVVKHRFVGEQSGMLVFCHFAVDYKRADQAQQGSTGQNIFYLGDTNWEFQGIRFRPPPAAVT